MSGLPTMSVVANSASAHDAELGATLIGALDHVASLSVELF
jgi:hypothetical protein